MSYTASSPSLSDRTQFPNFFRTMPSDIYQARAIARLTIRFKWTWIGAVVANNDYGLMAVKVVHWFYSYPIWTAIKVQMLWLTLFNLFCVTQIFQEETQGAGVCLAFVETLSRQNIVSDARRAAQAIQSSAAKVILIFTWYTDVRELFLQLVERNVRKIITLHWTSKNVNILFLYVHILYRDYLLDIQSTVRKFAVVPGLWGLQGSDGQSQFFNLLGKCP